MNNSRTANVARNMALALLCQVLSLLFKFIGRTIFIKTLGADYLGVNGLFTNILSILSVAELGIGNAIVFNMYKPLAVKDKERIKSLMNLYAKAYRLVGLIVFIVGVAIIPFMNFIIKDKPPIEENIIYIYLLFLSNTVLSYFFVYKKSIISADQKDYIISIYQQVFYIIQTVAQIILLLVTHNFILYLLVQILCTFLNNVFTSQKADKMYPYLKKEKAASLTKSELSEIFKGIRALFIYRFSTSITYGIDNIIISAIIGITAVGLASNYLLIISAVTTVTGQLMGAFTASVGNLNAIETTEKKEAVFNKMFFINAWLYGFCATGLLLFLNPFIEVWLGEEYLLSTGVVLALVINFYVNNVHFTSYTYLITMGLFIKGKIGPLIEASLNITLSIILGRYFGLKGIFMATFIATIFSVELVDPILVYKEGLGKNPIKYYLNYYMFVAIFIILFFIIKLAVNLINISGLWGLIVRILIMVIIFNTFMVLIFHRTTLFKELFTMIKDVVKRKLKYKEDTIS